MKKSITNNLLSKIIIIVITLTLFLNISFLIESEAILPGCGIKSLSSVQEFDRNSSKYSTQSDSDLITIQCGNAGNTWNGIKSSARLTRETRDVVNYEKSGKSRQRDIDFDKMPGKLQYPPGAILKKLPDGRTLAFYNSKDGYASLSFPSTLRMDKTDKVRYK